MEHCRTCRGEKSKALCLTPALDQFRIPLFRYESSSLCPGGCKPKRITVRLVYLQTTRFQEKIRTYFPTTVGGSHKELDIFLFLTYKLSQRNDKRYLKTTLPLANPIPNSNCLRWAQENIRTLQQENYVEAVGLSGTLG